MTNITVDKDTCIGCGACVDACPVDEYTLVEEKCEVTGDPEDCILCKACEESCPVDAITVEE
jgi:NAD-dependent dihydropyrimidine dehydrogenase PreA subunit